MAKAFWKGVISFGMVVIPVKMYTATESKSPGFHMLHKKCLTRPKQVLYCESDIEYFSSKETVRGYEYSKGNFVVLEDSDFNNVPVKTSHSIDILGFVELKEIDPVYYHGAHYLEPEELGVKPFVLLREALVKTQRVGIAKVAFQRREHLCSLKPKDDILVLHTLHFQDEILPHQALAPRSQSTTPEEMEMAVSLVSTMATDFTPEEYRDDYSIALNTIIEAKLKGEKITVPAAPKVEIPDLMAALKASLEAAQQKSADKEQARTATGKS